MKVRMLGIALAAAVLMTGGIASAQCCAKGKKLSGSAAKADSAQCGTELWSQIGVSADVQAKIQALQDECQKAGNTAESCGEYQAQIKELLTDEQLEKCRTLCNENGWKCPVDKKS